MSRLRRQTSGLVVEGDVTSVCSRSACVESTELPGSTTALEICGAGEMQSGLGLAAVVDREAPRTSGRAGARAAARGVEAEEALEAVQLSASLRMGEHESTISLPIGGPRA